MNFNPKLLNNLFVSCFLINPEFLLSNTTHFDKSVSFHLFVFAILRFVHFAFLFYTSDNSIKLFFKKKKKVFLNHSQIHWDKKISFLPISTSLLLFVKFKHLIQYWILNFIFIIINIIYLLLILLLINFSWDNLFVVSKKKKKKKKIYYQGLQMLLSLYWHFCCFLLAISISHAFYSFS